MKRGIIGESGAPGRTRTLLTRFTFLDDLHVSEQGMVVADYLGNAVRAFDLSGRAQGASRVPLSNQVRVVKVRDLDPRSGRARDEHAHLVL